MIGIEIHALDEAGVDEAIAMNDRLIGLGIPPELICCSQTEKKPKPTKVDGVDYSPAGIRQLRDDLIIRRDDELGRTPMPNFNLIVMLTHVIALLAYLAEREEEDR